MTLYVLCSGTNHLGQHVDRDSNRAVELFQAIPENELELDLDQSKEKREAGRFDSELTSTSPPKLILSR